MDKGCQGRTNVDQASGVFGSSASKGGSSSRDCFDSLGVTRLGFVEDDVEINILLSKISEKQGHQRLIGSSQDRKGGGSER